MIVHRCSKFPHSQVSLCQFWFNQQIKHPSILNKPIIVSPITNKLDGRNVRHVWLTHQIYCILTSSLECQSKKKNFFDKHLDMWLPCEQHATPRFQELSSKTSAVTLFTFRHWIDCFIQQNFHFKCTYTHHILQSCFKQDFDCSEGFSIPNLKPNL